jgi:nitrate/nitrite transporter NarK
MGLAVLTYSDGALWQIVFFVILFSFGDGINSVTWALVGDFFGRKQFGTIRGWIGMIQSLASMPAAVYTGWIYDQTQSYTYALIPFIVTYGLAGLVLWQAPRPKRAPRLEVSAGQALDLQP